MKDKKDSLIEIKVMLYIVLGLLSAIMGGLLAKSKPNFFSNILDHITADNIITFIEGAFIGLGIIGFFQIVYNWLSEPPKTKEDKDL